jgi:phenylacetate-CoA ligase
MYFFSLNSHASWSIDKLQDYQNKKLRLLMDYAFNHVPFYHKHFKDSGIRPSDIRSSRDLHKIPIIRKDDIRKNLDSMVSQNCDVERLKRLSTSGSTGNPLFFYVSQSELEYRKAKHLRANMACGQKPFDHWVTLTSPHHFAESTNLQRLINAYTPRPVSVFNDLSTQISLIERMKPDVLDGYSSTLYLLAKEIEKKENKNIKPRLIIGGAELIDDSSRRLIESIFEAPFYDQYSSVEMERIAWQCKCKQGYHIDSDALVLEFVNQEGEQVSEGECGEVVCTSLFNYAMPFIRYAIGDMGRFSKDSCNCGRPFPLMKVMEGRKDSMILLPDGRVIAPRAFTIAMSSFRHYDMIDQFRIIQQKKDVFQFIIKVKKTDLDKAIFERELTIHFAHMLKLDLDRIHIETELVDDIPLDPSGKLMAVTSRLDHTDNA